ncbi:7912_t:CDS:2, partial [Funneliformis geosporum]
MFIRSSKKRAIEKLATNTNKRGCKKKEEIVISDDDLDKLLTNTNDNVSQSKSKKKHLNERIDNINNPPSKTAEVETNQNSRPNDLTKMIPSRMLSNDSISNKRTLNNTLSNQTPSRTRDPLLNLSVNRVTPSKTYDSRSGSCISNDYTPNQSVTPSRILSRENSPTDYLSRNKFGFSNKNLRMISEKGTFDYMYSNGIRSSIPRANSPFGYIPSNRTVLLRPIPLGPKDNTLNISNNTTLTQDAMNFNTVEEIIPSPFN